MLGEVCHRELFCSLVDNLDIAYFLHLFHVGHLLVKQSIYDEGVSQHPVPLGGFKRLSKHFLVQDLKVLEIFTHLFQSFQSSRDLFLKLTESDIIGEAGEVKLVGIAHVFVDVVVGN